MCAKSERVKGVALWSLLMAGLALASSAAAAGPQVPPQASGPARRAAAVEQVVFSNEPEPRAARRKAEDASMQQIEFLAFVRQWLGGVKLWDMVPFCGPGGPPSIFCQRRAAKARAADLADALTRAPNEGTSPVLDAVAFPVVEIVPPVAYLQSFRRHGDVSAHLDPPVDAPVPAALAARRLLPAHLCHGACQQYVSVTQRSEGGGNSASVFESGPNAAVTAQIADGPAYNLSAITQTGACNHAVVIEAAMRGFNFSSVHQAGYGNSAMVLQH